MYGNRRKCGVYEKYGLHFVVKGTYFDNGQ